MTYSLLLPLIRLLADHKILRLLLLICNQKDIINKKILSQQMPISQTAGTITVHINNLRINTLKTSLEIAITNLLINLKRQRSALFVIKKDASQINILKKNKISQENDFKKTELINILQFMREKKIRTSKKWEI